ncbi:MAG: protein translocase subunit SecF, partial [Candidatus Micrarchaeaceae archaeon]
SIDTDMLAAIRILKRKEGTATERAHASLRTGTTMTFSAIIAFGVLFIVSYLAFIPTFYEISAVVLAGLVADLAITWLGNVPMILWYKHRKERRGVQ